MTLFLKTSLKHGQEWQTSEVSTVVSTVVSSVVSQKVVVLNISVFMVFDCIQMKPGEPPRRRAWTGWCHVDAVAWWVGTRGMGVRGRSSTGAPPWYGSGLSSCTVSPLFSPLWPVRDPPWTVRDLHGQSGTSFWPVFG